MFFWFIATLQNCFRPPTFSSCCFRAFAHSLIRFLRMRKTTLVESTSFGGLVTRHALSSFLAGCFYLDRAVFDVKLVTADARCLFQDHLGTTAVVCGKKTIDDQRRSSRHDKTHKLTSSQREWLHSSVARAPPGNTKVVGSKPVEA